jgi:hypothetical protein
MYCRKSVIILANVPSRNGGHHSQEDGKSTAIAADRYRPYQKPTKIIVGIKKITVVATRHEAPCECTCARAICHATTYATAMPTTGETPHASIQKRHVQNVAAPTLLCSAQTRQCRHDCLAVRNDLIEPTAWRARSTRARGQDLANFQQWRCLRTAAKDARTTSRRATATRARPAPRLLFNQRRLFIAQNCTNRQCRGVDKLKRLRSILMLSLLLLLIAADADVAIADVVASC